MKRLAHIYERNDQWYFQPSSRTKTGLWIATPPLLRLNKQEVLQVKWKAVMEALNASHYDAPIPADDADLVGPLLGAAKVNSWAAFMKHAKCIGLELDNNRLVISPQKKLPRPKGALEGMSDKSIVLTADSSLEEIGAALDEAMALSEL